MSKPLKLIFSGGGTGGHIFPAVAIAREFQNRFSDIEILFVGALGKMEMEKVPSEGFNIVGLPVEGLLRSASVKNIKIVFKAITSYLKAKKIIEDFRPDAVVGTGGFASLPITVAATRLGVPVFAWEGNGFAGLTNKLLKKTAKRIFCGFDGMDSQFPYHNWIHSGNPIRQEILKKTDINTAVAFFGLNPSKPIVFVTGGSLGARSINEAVESSIKTWKEHGIQVIWQTGKNYSALNTPDGIWVSAFLKEMHLAYSCADLVVSRSGATSVSEIMAVGVPAIFVPSPNVTDDHQTKNAEKATQYGGGLLIKDSEIKSKLTKQVVDMLKNNDELSRMRTQLLNHAKPRATQEIVDQILKDLNRE
jgi:UDP-N-acetylglucosamine--N-acetylmuramyl-(pentapeptide) pyrophosphoryl-undecaprenol N-acetylglucosamine transferase